MGTSDVAAWDQSDVPTDATAVFPADSVPPSNSGSDLTASDYTRATITYTDASGREVNTATPGGHITTTDYDQYGNTIRELAAGNRELALATSGDGQAEQVALNIDQMSSADRAELLSTRSFYSSDGLRETEEYGPLHQVTLASALKAGTGGTDLAAGTQWPARKHIVYTYDEGRPTDGTATIADQVTTTKVGAYVDGYPSDGDVHTSTTTYDWSKGLPTTTTTDPGGLAIARTTVYDAQGRVTENRQPKSDGTDADTTVTTYYSATGSGTCNGRPEWADLVCTTGPAGSITGGGSNPTQRPTKTYEYDRWGNTAKVTEAANGVTRTTTNTYDAAGRVTKSAISGGVGTAVPDTTTTYDTDNGKLATVSTSAGTITHTYDSRGREISYNDGAGNTATTAYDGLDRVVKVTDSAPSVVTYTYDTSKDPRGLATGLTDSVAGTFTATYDADGALTTEDMAGAVDLTRTTDPVGTATEQSYTTSDGTPLLADNADYDITGLRIGHTQSDGTSVDSAYQYDAAGRLTEAVDSEGTSCTSRGYGYDKNSNRTSLATTVSDCSSAGTTTSQSLSYDSSDRAVDSGYAYDAFGRTTSEPSGSTLTYYANDMARSLTSTTDRQTWSLDADGRLASSTTQTQGTDGTWTTTATETSHYGCGCDSPTWTAEDSSGTITRDVTDLTGNLAAITGASGTAVLQLTNLHGDVSVQYSPDGSQAVRVFHTDEFGNPTDTETDRYGWLGGQERSTATATDAILMGVRVYDPATGRFLQTDPVPGGSDNSYEYASQSPVSYADPAGTWKVSWGWTAVHITLSRRQNTELYSGAGWAAAAIGGIKKLGVYGRAAYYAFLGYGVLAWIAELYGKCLRMNISYWIGHTYPSFAKCARR
jgi:RHS repeat-associated protein